MLLGQARGKMGSIVFFVRDGAQQQRPYVEKQKNPRTTPQMLQRVKLAAVVGFYKRQASFFRFALKKKKNESYYNAFVRYNLNTAPYLTKTQVELGYQIPAPYIISDGDMPQIATSRVTVDLGNKLYFKTSINSSLATWGAMRKSYGLLMGDMITIVVFNRGRLQTDQTSRIVIQHVFDQESEDMPIGYDMVGTTWDGEGDVWSLEIDKSYFGVSEWYAVGTAIITSRNANGVDCSYAQLALSENAEAVYLTFSSESQHQEAAASYGSTQDAILDPNSFAGNYVDMAELFNDQALKVPVKYMVKHQGDGVSLFYDNTKFPTAAEIDAELISGTQLIENVVIQPSEHEIMFDCLEDKEGVAEYKFNFLDSGFRVVATAYLKLTVNKAP